MKRLTSLLSLTLVTGLLIFTSGRVIAQSPPNLLTNPGFENGTTGWENPGTVNGSRVRSGNQAYQINPTGTLMRQKIVNLTPGTTYQATGWVYIANVTGSDWGGVATWAEDLPSFQNIGGIMNMEGRYPRNTWSKYSFTFTPTGDQVYIEVGTFAGPNRQFDVTFDDLEVYIKPTGNTPPTVSISATPTTLTTIPSIVTFTSAADDPDGSVAYYFWDFGDGGKSNHPAPTHTYASNGVFTAKLRVYDADGASSEAQTLITVQDPAYPTLTVIGSPPEYPQTISNPSVTFSGTATGTISSVSWSTDRGLRGAANGTTNWSFTANLSNFGGRNRFLITATDTNGRVAKRDIVIDYRSSSPVTISGGSNGVSQNTNSIPVYDKFEATFSLANSVASNPYIPYETNVPDGIISGQGISVYGIFTSPTGIQYWMPGFYYQPFTRDTTNRKIVPEGNAVWKIRFTPTEEGIWTYNVSIADASTGLASPTVINGSNLQFTATAKRADNHGFIRVSQNDSRYFEFSDGTPFIGVGPGPGIDGRNSFNTDQTIQTVGDGSANFARTWMSGSNIGGSSWIPWAARLDYDGNVPHTSLTTDEAYGDGVFSFTLPAVSNNSRCAFFGWPAVSTQLSVKPNTNYRLMVRLKTVGITGNGGFTVRPGTSWPDSCDQFAGQALTIPYQTGTRDWHAVEATWNSGSRHDMSEVLMTMENTTGGRVYVDEISVREDLGGGNLGPEIMPRSKFNVHEYFSQAPAYNWDYGLDLYSQHNIYNKVVIEEKQDYVYGHISQHGYGYANGSQMQKVGGASHKWQQYYWRYLTARFGWSPNIHSWEFVNEDGPGTLTFANEMAKYFDIIDPYRHMTTTSFWCCIAHEGRYYWQDPTFANIDYADTHSYVDARGDDTSWLEKTDPITGGSLSGDSALFTSGHSLDSWSKGAAGGKPIVMGEAGFGTGTTPDAIIAGENDTDTNGVWLHQFLWAQGNPGAMYFIYWFPDTIISNGLYTREGFFRTYRRFMEGAPGDPINKRIPVANGDWESISATLPTNVYGWGQKDTTYGGAYLWMYHKDYTWRNQSGGSSLAGATVTFSGMPSRTYTAEWWNTWTGSVTTVDGIIPVNGTITLAVPSGITNKDVAVKLYPQGIGFGGNPPPGATITPTLTITATPTQATTPSATPTSSVPTPTQTPAPTGQPTTIRVGILGDSSTDEYHAEDHRGGSYYNTTYNWLELLVREKGIDAGSWSTTSRGEPRRSGYANNWARTGANAHTLITSGQHTSLTQQISNGTVTHAVIWIGTNDFSPNPNIATYQPIYNFSLSDTDLQNKINTFLSDMNTIVTAITNANPQGVILVGIGDPGQYELMKAQFPNVNGRNRATTAINSVNQSLLSIAQSHNIPFVDFNAFTINNWSGTSWTVGGETIDLMTVGDEPHHLVLGDMHIGTAGNAALANALFITPMNQRYGTSIPIFSDTDILNAAGIIQTMPTPTGATAPTPTRTPTPIPPTPTRTPTPIPPLPSGSPTPTPTPGGPTPTPGVITQYDWPTRGRTQNRSYSVPYDLSLSGSNKLNLRWKKFLGERVEVEMEPTVVGNLVYIGLMNGKMYAFDRSNGNTVWTFTTDTGMGIPSTPTIAQVGSNLIMFFGAIDGKVYALNAQTGARLWTFTTSGPVYATPSVHNNFVYIGSLDKNFYALNALTGQVAWQQTTTGAISNTAAIGETAPGSGVMAAYVQSGDNKAYGFRTSTGEKLWERQLNGLFTKRTMAVYGNGVVMFVTKKPGAEYSEPHENISQPPLDVLQGSSKDGPTVLAAFAQYYQQYPKRRTLYFLNAQTGADLWEQSLDKSRWTPLYIPYWGEYTPIVDPTGYAWFPASGSGGDHALDHNERLWKVNLATGEYTHVAYPYQEPSGTPQPYFKLRGDEVGRATLVMGSTQQRYYQTISEDVGYFDIVTGNRNGNVFGTQYTFGDHRKAIEIEEALSGQVALSRIFGGDTPANQAQKFYKFFTRFSCSPPSCLGGGNDAISPLVVAGQSPSSQNEAFVMSYGHLYALTAQSVSNPSKDYGTLDLAGAPSSPLTRDSAVGELTSRIQGIIAGGHINPTSRFTNWAVGTRYGTFWHHGEVVYSLAEALDYLTDPTKTNLINYLRTEVTNYLLNSQYYTDAYGCPNYETGQLEISCSGSIAPRFRWSDPYLVMERLYALYKYAHHSGDWQTITSNWNTIKSFYTQHVNRSGAWDETFGFFVGYEDWRAQNFIPSLQQGAMLAMREMATHAGDTATAGDANNKLTRMTTERIRWGKYVRDELYTTPVGDQKCLNANVPSGDRGTTYCIERRNYENPADPNQWEDWGYHQSIHPMPVEGYLDQTNNPRHIFVLRKDANGVPMVKFEYGYVRNEVYPPQLVGYHPLLSEFVNVYKNELFDGLDDYMKAIEKTCPFWYMSDYGHCAVYGGYEEDSTSPVIASDMFQVYARVYNRSFAQLAPYLPWAYENYGNADIFRIQNLVAILSTDGNGPTPAPTTTAGPSPSPTPLAVQGDANGDGHVDGIDYTIWMNHYNTTTTSGPAAGDFNTDGTVDGMDYYIWVQRYGT